MLKRSNESTQIVPIKVRKSYFIATLYTHSYYLTTSTPLTYIETVVSLSSTKHAHIIFSYSGMHYPCDHIQFNLVCLSAVSLLLLRFSLSFLSFVPPICVWVYVLRCLILIFGIQVVAALYPIYSSY